MYIEIRPTADGASTALVDPDNFREFKIVVAGEPEAAATAASIAALGHADEVGHVFVERDELTRLAGVRASDDAWLNSLHAMIGYADSQGWVDEAGRIRAHIDRRAD